MNEHKYTVSVMLIYILIKVDLFMQRRTLVNYNEAWRQKVYMCFLYIPNHPPMPKEHTSRDAKLLRSMPFHSHGQVRCAKYPFLSLTPLEIVYDYKIKCQKLQCYRDNDKPRTWTAVYKLVDAINCVNTFSYAIYCSEKCMLCRLFLFCFFLH